jgi:hypothetical protein
MYLNINGNIDSGGKVITMCCENIPDVPGVELSGSAEDTLERFMGLRTMLLAQGLRTPGKNSFGCKGCSNYTNGDWSINPFTGYVNLSMYPSPCQCKCCYCDVYKKWKQSDAVDKAYKKYFNFSSMP